MTNLSSVILKTPIWAWIFFWYLIWRGITSLRESTVPLWRVLTIPIIFIGLGLWRILPISTQGTKELVVWTFAACISFPLGLTFGPRPIAINRNKHTVTRAGSTLPIFRNVLLFAAHYAIGVLSVALVPPLRIGATASHKNNELLLLVLASDLLSGMTAGYFIGWCFCLWRRYCVQR